MPIDFPNGKSKIILRDSFESIATLALDKLGIEWRFGSGTQAYNHGETTKNTESTVSNEDTRVLYEGRFMSIQAKFSDSEKNGLLKTR